MKLILSKISIGVFLVLLSVCAANAQSNNSKNKSADDGQTKDRPLQIIEKQPPSAKIFGDCFRRYGTGYVKVAVRITFDKSGVVTNAEIVKASECAEFDEESVRVARKIKFKPQIKDGEAITVVKTAVYEGGVR